MEIPIMKVHVENSLNKFDKTWNNLLLEEKRDLPRLQDCQEAIHSVKQSFRTLSLELQREIRRCL